MKTTVELSDNLLVELKVIAAREHRRLRDVMEEILALGLRARNKPASSDAEAQAEAEAWLEEWQDLGGRVEARSADDRACVEILLADRR